MKPIYLDNNATTIIDPRVAEAIHECHLAGLANPASQHEAGRAARKLLEECRDSVAELLGAESGGDRVIFTSGGTESNNLALLGLAGKPPGRAIISAVEHPSVAGPAARLKQLGFEVVELPVDRSGVVDLVQLAEFMNSETKLVSIMLGNNETGVLQPVEEAARLCREANVPLHTDAVQAVGKIPVHFGDLGVTSLSLSAHKFHGPRGIGALLIQEDAQLAPLLFGGFQQMGFRPGTESVSAAVGLHRALQISLDENAAGQMSHLRQRLESLLAASCNDVVINGRDAPRLPHTSNISIPGLDRQALLLALDTAGVACSTGSACASGSSDPSPVLLAMGLPTDIVEGSLRLSLSRLTTPAEVDRAARCIAKVVNDLRQRKRDGFASRTARQRGRETI